MPMSFDHDESFSSDDFRGNINNIVNGLNESCGMSENALKPATMKSPPRPIVTSPLIDVVERTSSPMSALSAPVSSNGYHPDLEDIRTHEAPEVTMERIFHYPAKFMRDLKWNNHVRPRFKDSGRPYSRLRSD